MFLALLAALAMAGSAHAAFPGANGKLVFDAGVCNPNCDVDIFSMNPDGTGLTNLTNSPSRFEGGPVWSPDGMKIAFAARAADPDDAEIYVMNADGTGVTQLTNNTNAYDFWPTWSPDGTKIAFAKSVTPGLHDLYVMNADGTGETHLFDPAAFGTGPPLYPNWNSIGNRITFSGGSNIFVMAADGLSAGRLTNNFGYLDYASNPNFSPSSGKIVYSQEYECGDEIACGDIQTMNADGSGVTKVTDDYFDQEFPVWSPDGSRIAYQDEVDGLVLINPDGTNRTPIGPIFGRMDWQPLPGPQRNDFKNSAQFCKAKRAFMGASAFGQAYGDGGSGTNAFGNCVIADGR
jgi:Tol biopolymer transport system component